MKKIVLFALLATLTLFSCREGKDNTTTHKKLNVLCTSSMIGESVSHIVGDSVVFTTMMGPGVDPHLYKPTPKDLKAMDEADVIILNGLHLEGKVAEVLGKLKDGKTIIYMSDLVADQSRFINNTEFEGSQDPHFWFDTDLWKESLSGVTKKLSELDSSNATYFQNNWKNYEKEINEAETFVNEQMALISDSSRVLITSHDAFSYLGRKFNIEVRGLQGISTVAEFGLKDIANLVDYVVEKDVKSLFVESTVSDKAMKAVIDGVKEKAPEIKIGGTLYSDALGAKDAMEGSYTGMLKYNAKTIAEGLK